MSLATEAELGSKGRERAQATLAETLPGVRFLVALLLPLAAIKAAQLFVAPPTADEAYYWLWGQHLDWSYYDHPPLAAWLERLSGERVPD